jgi:SAM-dependent methyltransferase
MRNLSDDFWNNRYKTNDFGWDIGDVSEPLKKYIEQVDNKELKILIPGAGNAYEAEFLFKLGFKNVYVLDFAEAPLKNIKKRLPEFPNHQLIQQDFFAHKGQYDLIIEQTFFCAIDPILRSKYVQQMHELLAPNGKLVGLMFNDALNADKPPFGGNKEEYQKLFEDTFDIKKMEPCYNSIKPREGRELFVMIQHKA